VTVRAGSLPRASADALLPGTDGPLVSDVTGADGGGIGAGFGATGCTTTTGGSLGGGVVVVDAGALGWEAGGDDCANAARDASDSAKTSAIDGVRNGAQPR